MSIEKWKFYVCCYIIIKINRTFICEPPLLGWFAKACPDTIIVSSAEAEKDIQEKGGVLINVKGCVIAYKPWMKHPRVSCWLHSDIQT